jgi:hypothetical protein
VKDGYERGYRAGFDAAKRELAPRMRAFEQDAADSAVEREELGRQLCALQQRLEVLERMVEGPLSLDTQAEFYSHLVGYGAAAIEISVIKENI